MITIVFYVALCSNSLLNECQSFEPMSWNVSTEQEQTRAFKECSILANAYEKLHNVKEVDCYTE